MRTDAAGGSRACGGAVLGRPRRAAAICAVVVCAAAAWLPPDGARAAQIRVGAATEVRSIDFEGVHGLPQQELRGLLQTRSRAPLHGLRSLLGRLPLVPGPAHHRFHPRVLQEDVVRMRRRYVAAGFPSVDIRYDVRRVGDQDLLDITFLVDEGPPQVIAAASVTAADSVSALRAPPDAGADWRRMERDVAGLAGRRLDTRVVDALGARLQAWWRNRGYAEAAVSTDVRSDSLRSHVRFRIAPGPRSVFGPIVIEGNTALDDRVIRRELAMRPGELYSADAVAQARLDLQKLQIIRAARARPDSPVPDDSTGIADVAAAVPVTVTVTEGKPRLISGQVGYVTDAGLSAEARWSHLNFTGGGRAFTVSGLSQSGLLAAGDDPEKRYRGTVSLQQPYLLHRRLSGIVSPFVEYRDDLQDRSLQYGSNFTVVYRRSRLLTGSLDYQLARRRVYEYRLGELASGGIDLLTYLQNLAQGAADSLGSRLTTSLVTLSALAGTLDDTAVPHRGVLVRPTLQLTAPTGASSTNYWKADCTAYVYAPLGGRVTLAGRFSAGRLFPFGKSLPEAGTSPTTSFLRLRDAAFTAGGSADVRGWGYRRLGPKFPDMRFTQVGDSLVVSSSGYVPLGGHSRTSFTTELRLPLPGLGPRFGWHAFLDGGRVWTDDERFDIADPRLDEERWFYATGAGFDYLTPVGAVRLSLGYKLNPSLIDLVDAGDYTAALLRDDLSGLPEHNSRRWQLNLAIGASY